MQWVNTGQRYSPLADALVISSLPGGVYDIVQANMGELSLTKGEEFIFPEKKYGLETSFIHKVIKTINESKRANIGMLFVGPQGTGKTITAQSIAVLTGLPIIRIQHDYNHLVEFISQLAFDCVLLFDEFEKTFDCSQTSILKILDSANNNGHRKISILTSNTSHVNANLLNRPGRIRYYKEFGSLERDQIREIVNDVLIDKTKEEELIDYISQKDYITIDVVTALTEEINIHGGDVAETCKYMNADQRFHAIRFISSTHLATLRQKLAKPEEIPSWEWSHVLANKQDINEKDIDTDFMVKGGMLDGVIKEILVGGVVKVRLRRNDREAYIYMEPDVNNADFRALEERVSNDDDEY